jgi:hypothetical protein
MDPEKPPEKNPPEKLSKAGIIGRIVAIIIAFGFIAALFISAILKKWAGS